MIGKSFIKIFIVFILCFAGQISSKEYSKQLKYSFSNLEEARDALRKLKKKGRLPHEDIIVYIKEGIYFIDKTFQLTSEDSGTETATITYKPYKGEKVHFIGGKMITDFEPLHNESALLRISSQYHDKIYQIDLKKLGISDFGDIKPTGFGRKIQSSGLELFYNNEPMKLARYPNQGWMRIDSVPQTGQLIEKGLSRIKQSGIPLGRHYGRFTYKNKRPAQWIKNEDVWLHGYWTHDWADSYVKVASIDTLKNEFILSSPHGVYGYTKNQRYYAFNILEELDSPGEWYLDKRDGILYFWPPSPIDEGIAYVSVLEEEMINLTNVSHIRIEGFTFEGTRREGIIIKGGSNNIIGGCTIRNIGSRGILVEGGRSNGIKSCNIYNIGDEGIILSGGDRKTLSPANHYAINNHIFNYSRINRTLRPAIKLSGVGSRIAHNLIHDAPHTGVIFDGNDHTLEFNEIYDIAKETGDVGAFYIGRDWTKRGNVIKYNYFHHLYGPGAHGLNAVYLDDAASGTTIYGNIFHNVDRGIFIGGGHDNSVENNVFINCKRAAIYMDARGLTWAKNYISKNGGWRMYEKLNSINYKQPPYCIRYPELASILEGENPAVPTGNRVQKNICYGNWIQMQDGATKDYLQLQNNYRVDNIPNYINVEQGKVYPKNESKLKTIGHKKIPFDSIGLYKDRYRSKL